MKIYILIAAVFVILWIRYGQTWRRHYLLWRIRRTLRRHPYARALRAFVDEANKEAEERWARMTPEERERENIMKAREAVDPVEQSAVDRMTKKLQDWNGEEDIDEMEL